MSGMLGIGGGIILVPVWINKGIDKSIAAASSSPLILFSSSLSFFIRFISDYYKNS